MEFIIIISAVITMLFIAILCIESWKFKNIIYCVISLSITICSLLIFMFYRTEKINTSVSDSLQINDIEIKFEKPMLIKEIYHKPALSIDKYDVRYIISNNIQ